MEVWIVFEYDEYGNKIIGVYHDVKKARGRQKVAPTWRYIEKYEVE